MDSANSGSMQSSSGGDEEYDSRPAFFNPNFSHLSNPQHPLSLLPHQEQSLFDPNSQNFFQTFSQSPQNPNLNTSLLNLDAAGSRELRSELDCTKPSGLSVPNAQFGSSQAPVVPSMQLGSNGGRCSSPSDQTQAVARNPKKRTRASRRAPTTVLTTDTSNFRAMVQEFTGIPAPPFSASPYSRRLDLLCSSMRSSTGGHLEPVASSLYPLRPSAQKVHQQSPFLFSTSSSSSSSSSSFMNNNFVDSSTNTTTNNININTKSVQARSSNFNPSSINYQLPSEPQNLLHMQTQMFSFQPLLPSAVLHPSFNVPSKSQLPLNSLEEIGVGQGQVNANLNSHGNSWRDHGNNQDQLRSIDSCKLNNSSSDFHHEKGLENVPPRGEGTVDSWICPSD